MDGDQATGLLERNPWVTRRKFDVGEYYRLAEAGILREDDRVELIEGEIVQMVPIGSGHSGTVNRLNYALLRAAGDRAVVTVQNPLRLSDTSEPIPDFLVLRPRPDFYADSHPTAADVLVLIEVAQSSLRYDRGVKLPLYARHGVPEVWIVDLAGRVVEVHRKPGAEAYAESTIHAPGAMLEPALLPGLRVAVADILG
jgi:Uma2 family endonuclease